MVSPVVIRVAMSPGSDDSLGTSGRLAGDDSSLVDVQRVAVVE